LLYSFIFGPAGRSDSAQEEFVVRPDESFAEITSSLGNQGLIRHEWAFTLAAFLSGAPATIRPGGYILSRGMDVFSVLSSLSDAPYLAWITVPTGLRKEQVAAILRDTLGWNDEEIAQWQNDLTIEPGFTEGVYFPGAYLVPSDLPPAAVARQMRGKFEDELAQYERQAEEQGKSWVEVVTLASLIERESAKTDKALIAGILENRLKKKMLLQVDATLQYIEGTPENGWWPAPNVADKKSDSPYNTYKQAGLPPQPIATPSIDSIKAVLNPQATSCLYYLHDTHGVIHCSPNYAGQLANVKKYL
jgi:UPF0755 protein